METTQKYEKISYMELARRVGDVILCNNITNIDDYLYDNLENGDIDYCNTHKTIEECEKDSLNCNFENKEIYQYYLIDKNGADYLKENTYEIVFYCEPLDLWVWGITHFGTSWSGVFTNIKD